VLGDPSVLRALLVKAGITDASIETRAGVARFPSVRAWMRTDVKGWTLADVLDGAQFARLLGEAQEVLRPFVSPDGTVSFPAPAHIVCAEKKPAVDL
jgi:hypothetical protein